MPRHKPLPLASQTPPGPHKRAQLASGGLTTLAPAPNPAPPPASPPQPSPVPGAVARRPAVAHGVLSARRATIGVPHHPPEVSCWGRRERGGSCCGGGSPVPAVHRRGSRSNACPRLLLQGCFGVAGGRAGGRVRLAAAACPAPPPAVHPGPPVSAAAPACLFMCAILPCTPPCCCSCTQLVLQGAMHAPAGLCFQAQLHLSMALSCLPCPPCRCPYPLQGDDQYQGPRGHERHLLRPSAHRAALP